MVHRVWDQFLTQADREHVTRVPTRRRGIGSSPALLMIDLYRKVFGDEPRELMASIDTVPGGCGLEAWNALPALEDLLRFARQVAMPVVHLTGLAGIPRWSDAVRDGNHRTRDTQAEAAAFEIIPPLAPVDGEIVLRKTGPSAFWGTPLPGILNRLGADSLIVAGESTSGCVRASVVDACSYQYPVWVVEECVFDRHEAPHAMSLFDMDRKYADVVSLDEIRARFGDAIPENAPSHSAMTS